MRLLGIPRQRFLQQNIMFMTNHLSHHQVPAATEAAPSLQFSPSPEASSRQRQTDLCVCPARKAPARAEYGICFAAAETQRQWGMSSEGIARVSLRIRQGSKLHLSAPLRLVSSHGHEKFLNEITRPSALLISAYASEDFCKPSGLLPGGDDATGSAL